MFTQKTVSTVVKEADLHVLCEILSDADWREAGRVLKVLRPGLDIEAFAQDRDRLKDEGYRLIGIRHEGALVAVGSYVITPHPVHFRDLQIHDMATLEAFQSKGYGSLLLSAMERVGVENRCGRCCVNSRSERDAAHRFYVRNGYEDYAHGFVKKLG
jgi:GNAT superfamily N-acetyltransferase